MALKKQSEYDRRWRLKYPEKLKELRARYRERNREKLLLRGKLYRAQNRKEILARSRERYLKNREAAKTRCREYRAKNHDRLLLVDRLRSAKYAKAHLASICARKKKYVAELKNFYIKNLLTRQPSLKHADIPPELVELKRAQLKLHRAMKGTK